MRIFQEQGEPLAFAWWGQVVRKVKPRGNGRRVCGNVGRTRGKDTKREKEKEREREPDVLSWSTYFVVDEASHFFVSASLCFVISLPNFPCPKIRKRQTSPSPSRYLHTRLFKIVHLTSGWVDEYRWVSPLRSIMYISLLL